MSDTPEIAGAKRKLEEQATELPNWARQLLDYIAKTERENEAFREALERIAKEPTDQVHMPEASMRALARVTLTVGGS